MLVTSLEPILEMNRLIPQGVSIGVTTGLCFCGVVGHDERHEYTVIGHQVRCLDNLLVR